MKEDIRNKDEQGKLHGKQISYNSNGNIRWIKNYHHGAWHGYKAWFNHDKSIAFKQYWNMDNRIYDESHWTNQQIEIKI